jgi:uncharacterized Rmd1/YagE family protein
LTSGEEQEDPLLLDLAQRVSRLEARVEALEKITESVNNRVERVDLKTWWILSGIVVSILVQVLFHLVR